MEEDCDFPARWCAKTGRKCILEVCLSSKNRMAYYPQCIIIWVCERAYCNILKRYFVWGLIYIWWLLTLIFDDLKALWHIMLCSPYLLSRWKMPFNFYQFVTPFWKCVAVLSQDQYIEVWKCTKTYAVYADIRYPKNVSIMANADTQTGWTHKTIICKRK